MQTEKVKNKKLSIKITDLKEFEEVVPCMLHSKKKKRAELIVKYYKQYTPRNGKYTQELIKKKISFNEQVMGIQMRGAGAY